MANHQPSRRTGVVSRAELPDTALLLRYLDAGAYTDCYVTEIAGTAALSDYVTAFYTTPLFKVERLILAAFVTRPSTDAEARDLAAGKRSSFAAWNVEARASNQLLLCDFQGRTRSWLMVVPSAHNSSTRLFFGSAVVPVVDKLSGNRKLGFGFNLLLGFHKWYSRALLRAAYRRLIRLPPGTNRLDSIQR